MYFHFTGYQQKFKFSHNVFIHSQSYQISALAPCIRCVLPIWEQWRNEGGFEVFKPPPRNSEGPPKNRAKLNPIVKTVKKIAEFRTPKHQDVPKKRQ